MAGTLLVNTVILGDSATLSQNLVIKSNVDGTFTIERQDGTDLLTIDAAGKVVATQNAQTWQNMTASRAVATNYVNNTPLPIKVAIRAGTLGAASFLNGEILGVTIVTQSFDITGYAISVYWEVPPYATYACNVNNVTITSWMELR